MKKKLIIQKLDGSTQIIEREETEEEIQMRENSIKEHEKRERISQIKKRLNQLSQDFSQSFAGRDFGTKTLEDGTTVSEIELRKQEFENLHNELRVLEGKEIATYTPRVQSKPTNI